MQNKKFGTSNISSYAVRVTSIGKFSTQVWRKIGHTPITINICKFLDYRAHATKHERTMPAFTKQLLSYVGT
jgi:hypothetical protein